MKKLLTMGAAIVALALLFGSCGKKEDEAPPAAKKKPVVTGITLDNVTNKAGVAFKKDDVVVARPSNLPQNAEVKLNVTVSGKNKAKKTFSVGFSTEDTVPTDTTLATWNGSAGTMTVGASVPEGTIIKVTFTSDGDTSQKGVKATTDWKFEVYGNVTAGEDIDPTNPQYTKSAVAAIHLNANNPAVSDLRAISGEKYEISATVESEDAAEVAKGYSIAIANADGFTDVGTKVTLTQKAGSTTIWELTIADDATVNAAFTLTATSVGTKLNGQPATDVVKPLVTPFKWTVKHLKNFATTTDPQTDNEFRYDATTKRYTFFNNEATAWMDQSADLTVATAQPISVRDVSFVYIPVEFKADVTNSANWATEEAFGIEARIRVTKWRDGELHTMRDQIRQAVMLGVFENPDLFDGSYRDKDGNAITSGIGSGIKTNAAGLVEDGSVTPNFIGMRISPYGQHREWGTRVAADATDDSNRDTGSNQFGDTASKFPGTELVVRPQMGDTVSYEYTNGTSATRVVDSGKKEAFADQEYTYKLMRSSPLQYTFSLADANGVKLIDDYAHPANRTPFALRGEIGVYFGFIVSGVEFEVSDIKIYKGGELYWADAKVKDAVPYDEYVRRVYITPTVANTRPIPNESANYAINAEDWPTNVTLNAESVPATLLMTNKDVNWTITEGEGTVITGTVDTDSGQFVIRRANNNTGVGRATIKATPTKALPTGADIGRFGRPTDAAGTFTVYIRDVNDIPNPTSAVINAGRDSLMVGDGTVIGHREHVGVVVSPSDARQEVKWSIALKTGTGDVSDYATLESDNLNSDTWVVLKASDSDVTADETVVVVTATTKLKDGSDSTVVATKEFTIKKYDATADSTIWWWEAQNSNNTGTMPNSATPALINGKYVARAGGQMPLDTTTGEINLSGGGRFIVGSAKAVSGSSLASGSVSHYGDGQFDFTDPFKITVEFSKSGGTGSFWILLNCPRGGTAGGPVSFNGAGTVGGGIPTVPAVITAITPNGSAAQNVITTGATTDEVLMLMVTPDRSADGGILSVTVDPTYIQLRANATMDLDDNGTQQTGVTKDQVLEKSFLQFRTDGGSANTMSIKRIVIEYVD